MSTAMGNCEYVRRYYGVPAEIGRRVVVAGRPGVIAQDRGHYIGVNFDENKPGDVRNCHPTSEVVYEGLGIVRAMTPAQRRYQQYLEVADCFDGFHAWLKYASARSRRAQ